MTAAERPTFLVVDDEPEVLRSVHDLFRLRYRVLTAQRGLEAIAILRENDVQVILSDQRMPEMSGVELLSHAAKIRPDATRLLFTGHADISAVIDAINQGRIFRYISKPWEAEELEAIVGQAAERNQLVVERRQLIEELERKNAQLSEALRLKERFLEVASHELNTPVAVALGIAELWKLTEGPRATPTQLGWIDRFQAAGRRLAATVERMWTLLRADGFEAIEPRPIDLEPLIRRTLGDLEPFLADRRQVVDLRIDPALGVAEVDPVKIGDVLANLLLNAIKFTPDGGTIRCTADCEPGDRIGIRITDPGIGVPAEDRPYLFQPFFTGHDTRHHSSGHHQFKKRGIGLGLCLVKNFVELHGGEVTFRSEPSGGSTFAFTIPRTRKAPPAVAEPLPSAVAAELRLERALPV